MNKSKTHWPYTIIGLIIGMMIACIVTVVQSLDFPVEDDYSYFDKYQNVENNFNEIQKAEEKFLGYFEPKILLNDKIKLKNSFKEAYIIDDLINIKIDKTNDDNTSFDDVKIKAKIVRPHNTKEDKIVKVLKNDNGYISINTAEFGAGRWQLMIEYSYKDSVLFKRVELFKQS